MKLSDYFKKFSINKKKLMEINNYMHNTTDIAPIVMSMFHKYRICDLYAFMYNFISNVISENIVLTGSWALKIFQIQNFIF